VFGTGGLGSKRVQDQLVQCAVREVRLRLGGSRKFFRESFEPYRMKQQAEMV
jgi:hypothetical protein